MKQSIMLFMSALVVYFGLGNLAYAKQMNFGVVSSQSSDKGFFDGVFVLCNQQTVRFTAPINSQVPQLVKIIETDQNLQVIEAYISVAARKISCRRDDSAPEPNIKGVKIIVSLKVDNQDPKNISCIFKPISMK